VSVLTQPTRGRIALWVFLALAWLLLLAQSFAMDPGRRHFSWVGAVVWLAVLGWLLSCLWTTCRRYRTGG
jgi:hypothetical protein